MTEKKSAAKEDWLLINLEKGQLWFEQNWKKLAVVIIVLITSGLTYAYSIKQDEKEQKQLWNKAATLSSLDEKVAFLKTHPKAKAAKLLYLNCAREELDKKLFDQAKDHLSQFLSIYTEADPLAGTAHLLRAYAYEELGENDQALKDYEKASTYEGYISLLGTQAITRLKEE